MGLCIYRGILCLNTRTYKKGIFMPVALFAMGQENVQILKDAKINKVR